jgi:CheY-like chemotaxis protein
MRILYVEDNPANLFLVQRVARMGNHDVVNYADGQSALDGFKNDKPDLILMDVQLPGLLTGLDVVKALRAAGHKTPIIAVTAYAMSGDRERCLEAGCDGYLAKPLPVNELVELFKRYEPAKSAPAPAAATPPKLVTEPSVDAAADTVPHRPTGFVVPPPKVETAPPKLVTEPAVEDENLADTLPMAVVVDAPVEKKPVPPPTPEAAPSALREGSDTAPKAPLTVSDLLTPSALQAKQSPGKPEDAAPATSSPSPTTASPESATPTPEKPVEKAPEQHATSNGSSQKVKAENEP